ncbi:UsfY protein [Mycobacterium talmoniae]|nr:UsfY protein [Mycobacterium talmoniae]TDH49773.1 UsfY protein [Mycobacterium eburneum]
MKDNLFWPGFILIIIAFAGMVATVAVAAYRHYEWLTTTVLIAVLGIIAGALWFVVELRRVNQVDRQWVHARTDSRLQRRAA